MKTILLLSFVTLSSATYLGCYHHEYNSMMYDSQLKWFGDQYSGMLTPDL